MTEKKNLQLCTYRHKIVDIKPERIIEEFFPVVLPVQHSTFLLILHIKKKIHMQYINIIK